ncbi:MAG: hypothetical protein JO354_06915 [Verrucomicrobia bacterium]|nr:hypothetical protein [Verrucomicrobiota bacterium]
MRIASAQIRCEVGNVPANLRTIRRMSEQAKVQGAEWLVFPEMSDLGYVMEVIQSEACTWTEGAVPELQAMAKKLSLGIICGVSERADGAIFNSQVVIDGDGTIIGKYRKTHLFAVEPVCEEKCFRRGDTLGCASLGEVRAGLTICYDLRFPELYRALVSGCSPQLFLLSSAWPASRIEHLTVLATARAIENQSYFVVANRAGSDGRAKFGGSSMIVDPSGVVLARAGAEEEQLLCAEISPERVTEVRERMPVLEHRRTDILPASPMTIDEPACVS